MVICLFGQRYRPGADLEEEAGLALSSFAN
jgi:hypothetical protein